MLNLKCQFRYLPQRASLARVGSHINLRHQIPFEIKKKAVGNKDPSEHRHAVELSVHNIPILN